MLLNFKPVSIKISAAFFLLIIAVLQSVWMVKYSLLPVETALVDAFGSNLLLYGFFLFIIYSFNYYLPPLIRYLVIVIQSALIVTAWIFLCRTILLFFFPDNENYALFWQNTFYIREFIAWIIVCDFYYLTFLLSRLKKVQSSIQKDEQSTQMQKDAELFKLRQQLQPHFLFNSLNSINALIGQDPKQARAMVQQLSDFLRNTVKKEDNKLIYFEEELTDLQLYLSIEQIRFGHRLIISKTISPECSTLKIPPFLIQPLVENAIKYGLYGTVGSVEINIKAFISTIDGQSALVFSISNPYDLDAVNTKGTGFGLASVKRRLYLLFAQNDLLTIQQEEAEDRMGLFRATIKIPLKHEA